MPKRLAIVTQDPANYGGVLRLVEYIYERAVAVSLEPTVVHYGRFAEHPELSVSLANLLRGELNIRAERKKYTFRGMNALAMGAVLPEWEPNRIRANRLWKKELAQYDAYLLVTGSAHTGLPLATNGDPYTAWVSSTVASDRGERLRSSRTVSALIERLGMLSILKSEAKVLSSSDRLLAVSESASSELQPLSDQSPEVWPFPIDTDKFVSAPIEDRAARFVFVGRANDPRKRVGLFLDACRELCRYDPLLAFEAVIVSSVQDVSLQDLPNVSFRSNLSDEELIRVYQNSTAFVLTSEQEGLGIAAMEAMACGLPVISTRCGGPETFIEDENSGLFVTDDARKIAEAMHVLASQPPVHARLSMAARTRIERDFSQRVWNPKFEELILNLTNEVQND